MKILPLAETELNRLSFSSSARITNGQWILLQASLAAKKKNQDKDRNTISIIILENGTGRKENTTAQR